MKKILLLLLVISPLLLGACGNNQGGSAIDPEDMKQAGTTMEEKTNTETGAMDMEEAKEILRQGVRDYDPSDQTNLSGKVGGTPSVFDYCENNQGSISIEETGGEELWVCVLPDGDQCDQNEYDEGLCP